MVKVTTNDKAEFFTVVYMNDARVAFISNGFLTWCVDDIQEMIDYYSVEDWEQVVRDIAPVIAKQLKA